MTDDGDPAEPTDGRSAEPTATDATPTATAEPTTTLTATRTPEPRTATATPNTPATPTTGVASERELGAGVDGFGRAVALSEAAAIVVAEGHGAYAFDAAGGWEGPTLLSPEATDDEGFGGHGVSAAMVDTRAVIGGPSAGPDPNGGAMYLFERNDGEWVQQRRFGSAGDDDTDEFGRSVAFDGSRIVVGDVHRPYTMVPWTGGVEVFAIADGEWRREASLGTDASDLFGTAVAVDGDVLLVGAPYADPDDDDRTTGAVYAYEFTDGEWERRATLSPAEFDGGEHVGQSVALDGDRAVVGAPGDGDGSAVVYEREGREWTLQTVLPAPGGDAEGGFGDVVATADGTAVVAAPDAVEGGRAYAVPGDDWSDPVRLAADVDPDAEFGADVALAGDAALVGAPVSDDASDAYLYDLSSLPNGET
ncbi:hypothetical protein GCM10009000_056030 [Halobacterium noricense]